MTHKTRTRMQKNFEAFKWGAALLLENVRMLVQEHCDGLRHAGQEEEADFIKYLERCTANEPQGPGGAWEMWLIGIITRLFTDYAKEGAELNPLDPHIQAMLGIVLGIEGDLEGAEAAFDRAVALGPNDPDTLLVVAWSLALIVGRAEEAVRHGRRAMALDPASSAMYAPALAVAQYAAGEYEEVVATLRLAPLDGGELMMYSAMAQAQLGHVEEAREAAERIRTEFPSFTVEGYIRDFPVNAPAALASIREGAVKADLLPAATQ